MSGETGVVHPVDTSKIHVACRHEVCRPCRRAIEEAHAKDAETIVALSDALSRAYGLILQARAVLDKLTVGGVRD